ncbi:MAG: hypothetical protein L3J70_10880 [Gammaproteobacteria bacterium]|nr:hypothetical protein [Gammaproteobacteria bacterium]
MKNLSLFIFVTSCIFLLSACGGDKDDSKGNLTYTGNTDRAIITDSNANQLNRDAYTNTRNGSSASNPASFASLSHSPTQSNSGSGLPYAADIANTVLSAVNQIDKSAFSQKNHSNTRAISESTSENGSCGGNFNATISADDQTGSFTGSFVFNNYCENNITINGSMGMSGVIDQNADEISSFKITFISLQTKGLGESITMDGDMLITAGTSDSDVEITMNALIRDDILDEVSKLENMRLSISVGYNDSTLKMSGRIYDHQYGYADITTPVAFKAYDSDGWPSSGELLISGADGTKARLTAFSASYRIEADTTGDGSYDYSEDFNWEE